MFYITGDTHGEFSRIERFCETMNPTPDDTLIILGDASTLTRHPFYKRLYDYVASLKAPQQQDYSQLPPSL